VARAAAAIGVIAAEQARDTAVGADARAAAVALAARKSNPF